ncbi:Glycosyltransferase involved in cell wall bisynthesis [Actinopolyspora xinjiangensis]|uniref:Glycosyltransferase involved in cell wall bisynthesis n=1 Tax=Actinopolyspora xinjiangensis TaxID=405564 RepID=A0A1H0X0X5_9ACTN|nr:glycosyltransferase [Actinopolyspora xinjiangensis]SDP96607.1 Glycosyltransferase involved in cell wall bisynthesis [Actinopolyspora xinjiangensis]
MTRRISVITPVHGPSAHYLPEAYRSLTEQTMPAEWDWEWLIQEDGDEGILPGVLPDDPRIKPDSGRRGGAGMARTMALSRATGELVKVLDSDDLLTEGALARDIEALSSPHIDWTTSRVLDLLPDGSTVGFDQDPDEGILSRGTVLEHWRNHNHRAQVHPATLCVRTTVLVALGGWMALPASEDTGLLLALDAVTNGYFTSQCGLLYRKWEGQTTNHEAHSQGSEYEARMNIIEARAQALTDLFPALR